MNGVSRSDAAQPAVESACARRRVPARLPRARVKWLPEARRFIPAQGEAIDAFRAEALS